MEEALLLDIESTREGDLLWNHAEPVKTLPGRGDPFRCHLHFTKDELLTFVDEVFDVLKPSGRLLIHPLKGKSPFVVTLSDGDIAYEQSFTLVSLPKISLFFGFSRQNVTKARFLPAWL